MELPKKTPIIKTKTVKEKSQQEKLQEAAQLLQENRNQREQQFQKELAALCHKYGVNLSSQILITAN
jgi:hypothetical protein